MGKRRNSEGTVFHRGDGLEEFTLNQAIGRVSRHPQALQIRYF